MERKIPNFHNFPILRVIHFLNHINLIGYLFNLLNQNLDFPFYYFGFQDLGFLCLVSHCYQGFIYPPHRPPPTQFFGTPQQKKLLKKQVKMLKFLLKKSKFSNNQKISGLFNFVSLVLFRGSIYAIECYLVLLQLTNSFTLYLYFP